MGASTKGLSFCCRNRIVLGCGGPPAVLPPSRPLPLVFCHAWTSHPWPRHPPLGGGLSCRPPCSLHPWDSRGGSTRADCEIMWSCRDTVPCWASTPCEPHSRFWTARSESSPYPLEDKTRATLFQKPLYIPRRTMFDSCSRFCGSLSERGWPVHFFRTGSPHSAIRHSLPPRHRHGRAARAPRPPSLSCHDERTKQLYNIVSPYRNIL